MNIELFKNTEFGSVRVIKDEKDEVWFVAKDVSDILGYRDAYNMVRVVDEEDTHKVSIPTNGGEQEVKIINESGLYSAILRSKKPEAKKFKRWVTSEVLPSIRKHGIYATEETIDKMLNDSEFGIKLLTKLKEEKEARVKAEEERDKLIHQGKKYTSTEIAKELGLKSAQALNKLLKENGIQYKLNGTWVLTARYSDKGYEAIKQEELDNGVIIYNRKWTGKGRDFILSLLK